MNPEILQFIKEMKASTKVGWVYTIEAWEYAHLDDGALVDISHFLDCGIDAFKRIEKESAEELIAAFPMIRKLVEQLLSAKETQKQLAVKLLPLTF